MKEDKENKRRPLRCRSSSNNNNNSNNNKTSSTACVHPLALCQGLSWRWFKSASASPRRLLFGLPRLLQWSPAESWRRRRRRRRYHHHYHLPQARSNNLRSAEQSWCLSQHKHTHIYMCVCACSALSVELSRPVAAFVFDQLR